MTQRKKERIGMMLMYSFVASVVIASMLLTSCGTTHGCHSKGHYVSKDIKRAQNKPRN
jgi:predicted small secreted protein